MNEKQEKVSEPLTTHQIDHLRQVYSLLLKQLRERRSFFDNTDVRCPLCQWGGKDTHRSDCPFILAATLAASAVKGRRCPTCGHSNVNSKGECRQCIDWNKHVCDFSRPATKE